MAKKEKKEQRPDFTEFLFTPQNNENENDINPQFEKIYELLKDYMDADKGLDLKTEIPVPLKTTILKLFAVYLKSKKMEKSSQLLDDFLTILFRYMFSHKRLSRKEFLEIFKSLVSSSLATQENVNIESIETSNELNKHLRM